MSKTESSFLEPYSQITAEYDLKKSQNNTNQLLLHDKIIYTLLKRWSQQFAER